MYGSVSKKYRNIFKYTSVLLVIFAFTFTLLFIPAGKYIFSDQVQIKVFIDPGHGGSDPGAVANGLLEKNANISIALKLKNKLQVIPDQNRC